MIEISQELIFAGTRDSKISRKFNFVDQNFYKILKQKKHELARLIFDLNSLFLQLSYII